MRNSLTTEQKLAAASSDVRIFIEAAPGSGKTTVAAERYGVLRFSARDGRGVLGLSFARSARGELESRIRRRWGGHALSWPNKTLTLDRLHSELVHFLLRTGEIHWPGDHTKLTVLDTWRGQAKSRNLIPQFQAVRRIAILDGREVNTRVQKLLKPRWGYSQKEPYEENLSSGLSTHDEIRNVLRDALRDNELRGVVREHLRQTMRGLIVDEVFDGNDLDLELVRVAIEADLPTTLIGDPWQALYEFRGAQPDLVSELTKQLDFKAYSVQQSFRFVTDEMQSIAERARTGVGLSLQSGSVTSCDVILSSTWRRLWLLPDDVLPIGFGQIENLTDAAMALLLDTVIANRFDMHGSSSTEAATAVGLGPEALSEDLPEALKPVLNRFVQPTLDDPSGTLELLRDVIKELSGQYIPKLSTSEETKRVGLLEKLAARTANTALLPGMTVHQAKGCEWNHVGLALTGKQLSRLKAGLAENREGDRGLYVALTRARESVVRV